MKKILLAILLLSTVTSFAKKYDIEGTKSGGQKIVTNGGTTYIGYQYVHYKQEGNTVTFTCWGSGEIKCRGNIDGKWMNFVTSHGNTFNYDRFDHIINSLLDKMDEMFERGNLSNRYTMQVNAVSNEGNSCNLVFGIVWNLNADGDGKFFIKIDEYDLFNF